MSSINLHEAHYLGLPSQSNVYCLTNLCTPNSGSKLLIATLKRQLYSLEYVRSYGQLLPSSKEVHFTYIPNGAEIISIDAFTKSDQRNDYVIGITFSMNSDNQVNQYFNIYFDWEPQPVFTMESAQSVTSLALPFIPFLLYHAKVREKNTSEVVWLLSGSDCQVHLFRENKSLHKYTELPVGDLFPEMESLPSIALAMAVENLDNSSKRITAVGCEGGEIKIAHVNTDTKEIISSWNVCHDGPVSSIQLFPDRTSVNLPADFFTSRSNIKSSSSYHLLVTNSLEPSVVYRDVLENGFGEQHTLPDSEKFDCATCSCIADLDMDGCNEVVIGTYGQELLVYKWSINKDKNGFTLTWQRTFANPLHAISYVDVTGDGMKELVVLSVKGLHIMQHSIQDVAKLCEERLEEFSKYAKKELV